MWQLRKRHRRTAAVEGDRRSPRPAVDGACAVLPRTPTSIPFSCSARRDPIGISPSELAKFRHRLWYATAYYWACCYAARQYYHCTSDIERVYQQVTELLKDF
jgi:hypothetical protein